MNTDRDPTDSTERPDESLELSFRTSAGSDPHGRPRVFFTCDPEDFGATFESTVRLILKHQPNCAVWYLPPDTALSDEKAAGSLRAQLAEMQLVVIPVTRRLLVGDSAAMRTVVPFALGNHIPLLPLLTDTGLEDLFTQRFGSVLFLTPQADDDTAAPFEKKLAGFLSGVLVGDEVAQRVRDAFDAYIFLSYRKKDRRAAQELMRLIHGNERFRDIAIWYDEYLIPGENFNDAIRKALLMSNLFALVVTPSLLERTDGKANYVMEHEYPAAVEASKTILPVEMSDTDPKDLKREFSGIPDCVDGRDADALLESLVRALKDVALKKRGAEHNFLIGLAFLDGIDVEVDHGIAVQLITEAADAGLLEAMRKLAVMYDSGKGVERDPLTSIEWQEKIVSRLREIYEKDACEANRHELAAALIALAVAYYDADIVRNAKELLKDANSLCRNPETAAGRRDLLECCRWFAEVDRVMGRSSAVYRDLETAVEICRSLVEESPTVENRRDLAVFTGRLGRETLRTGDRDEARALCAQSVELCAALLEESRTVENMSALARSAMLLGELEFEYEAYDEAERRFKQALEIRQFIAEETGTVASRRDLAETYRRLGRVALRKGEPALAKELFLQALAIVDALFDETGSSDIRSDAARICQWLSYVERRLENAEAAREYDEKSREIDREVDEERRKAMEGHQIIRHYEEYDDIIV